VGKNGSLWDPCCPGGIHEDVRVFIARRNLKPRLMHGGFQKAFLIILRPGRARWSNPNIISIGEIQTGPNGRNHLFKLGVKDDHPGATIVDDKFEFRAGQSPVQRNENGTDFRDGKKDFDILMTIVKKDRDSISPLDSQVQKKMAESIGPQIDFLVGKGAILKN
jgi:hypothetical protein